MAYIRSYYGICRFVYKYWSVNVHKKFSTGFQIFGQIVEKFTFRSNIHIKAKIFHE